jgi:hypothetical protein
MLRYDPSRVQSCAQSARLFAVPPLQARGWEYSLALPP